MQERLLDILILGLLILLFGSIYRKRGATRLRFWVLGWFFILAHFGVLLPNPVSSFWENSASAISLSTLFLSGICFVLASTVSIMTRKQRVYVAVLLSIPALLYIGLTSFGFHSQILLYPLVMAGEVIVVILTYCFYESDAVIRRVSVSSASGVALWMAYEMSQQQAEIGVYAILTQLFLMNAVLYWRDFRRVSAGVMTVVLGLSAWAAVFPCALLIAAFLPNLHVASGLWNVPKYFVAFGMILVLVEEQLLMEKRQGEQYRLLFEGNPHPMWIYDRETLHYLKVNEAAVSRYGYSEEEFMQMTLRDIRVPEEVKALEEEVAAAADSVLQSGPWTHIKKNGSRIQVETASQAIHFEGHMARFSLVQDVTERQQLHEQLMHLAHHDTLTGLPNRLLLKDRMQQALAAAARHERKAAIVCIDLDRFKQINDTYGHTAGDHALKHVAERLHSRIRAMDTVSRSGGEEFTLLLGDLLAAADAETVAKDLLRAFESPFPVDGYMLDIKASLGIAIYPDDGTDADHLWRSADVAMYRAKNSGGDQYVFVSHEISTAAAEAGEIEICLRHALKDGGLELYYQPQYALNGRFCGLEALLRLHSAKFGIISPERFIPIAEESGLIISVGTWVLEEVCRQSAKWSVEGLPPVRIAMNVSPLQFMRTDFSHHVQQVLEKFAMDPKYLEIEITETTVMGNLDEIARQMNDLAGIGVQFSVDDFGTGYSSLKHLYQLPIRNLKIDRSFIEKICDPGGSYTIVQAMISLAHSLDMLVVAEGVEREDQLAALASLNCDMLQGYLYSQPKPAEEIYEMIAAGGWPGRRYATGQRAG